METSFTAEILSAARDEATRRELAALLRKWSGQRVYIAQPRNTRPIDAAKSLHAVGTPRADAARILAERFGLSGRHCRRVVARIWMDPAGQPVSAPGRSITT